MFKTFDGSLGKAVDPEPFRPAVTISQSNPAVVSWTRHQLSPGDPVFFRTTGTLPSPLTPDTLYFVRPGPQPNSFRISATLGGGALGTTSAGSGEHRSVRPVVRISAANPAVVTWKAHGLAADDPVVFQSAGQLPAPLEQGQIYYVLNSTTLTADTFQISTTRKGTPVDTSASTTHTQAHTIPQNPLYGSAAFDSPLLWLGQRLAKNRERLGVHYASDSNASRHLAAAVWRALLHEPDPAKRIVCPTLDSVISRAKAEWPTKW